jgi:hypothetical protein
MATSTRSPVNRRIKPASPRKRPAPSPARPTPAPERNRSACEEALDLVIGQARRLAEDSHQTRGALQSGRSAPSSTRGTPEEPSPKALDGLTATLRSLDPETALKIRTLMIAGRDGQSIGAVDVKVSLADTASTFAIMATDSGENGPLLIEYLLRGHAIACAAGIDLDRSLADWQARSADDVDERAWMSFGRQLAKSLPHEWQCIGVVDPGTRKLAKLYLKLGDRAWWSFQSLIDRPTQGDMAKEQKGLGRRRSRAISTNSLDSLVSELDDVSGRALQRAGRAIRARVGSLGAAAKS